MPKKKLNLLQFTACGAAKPSAASTEMVRGEFAYANLTGELLDDVPDQLFRDSLTPNLAGAAHAPKEAASFDSSRSRPVVEQADHPVIGDRKYNPAERWNGELLASLSTRRIFNSFIHARETLERKGHHSPRIKG
jgi:hypothetical protein